MSPVISLENCVAILSLFQNITKCFMELLKKFREKRENRLQKERREKFLFAGVVIGVVTLIVVTLAQKT